MFADLQRRPGPANASNHRQQSSPFSLAAGGSSR
jgi:hypothetical protein